MLHSISVAVGTASSMTQIVIAVVAVVFIGIMSWIPLQIRRAANDGSARPTNYTKREMIEKPRKVALKLCADHGVSVHPYAGGWWLVGEKTNRVIGELAGLCISALTPIPIKAR